MKAPKIAAVEWLDACISTGWTVRHSDEVHQARLGVVNTTVGYLLRKDKDWTVVACEKSDQDSYRDITQIPTALVKKLKILR